MITAKPVTTPQQTPQAQGGNGNGAAGAKSWSSITSGQKSQGVFLNQEEFPQLAAGVEERSPPPLKKEEESKESPYGPGPSLRPQSKLEGLAQTKIIKKSVILFWLINMTI